MSHCRIFFNFIRANCKRLIHYLPSMFVSFALLLILTGTAGFFLSSHLYKEADDFAKTLKKSVIVELEDKV